MLLQKFLIDGLAATKAFVHAVPEPDAGLAELPAETNFLAMELRGEVDQADVQVLYYASIIVDFLEQFLQVKRDILAPVPLLPHFGMIHQHASEHRDAVGKVLPPFLSLLVFGFERDRVTNCGLHLRKQLFGLLKGEEPGHPIKVGQVYTPETWTARDRLLGPSNSAKMMLCQVPRSTDAFRTCRHNVWPISMPRR